MQLYANKLAQHLNGQLAPVYLISGDEPLQQQEAADAVRQAARDQGYEEREVLDTGTGFSWNELSQAAGSMSLFATRKIIDLRVAGKLGKEGGEAIRAFLTDPPPDTLLLVTMGKIDARSMKSAWVKAMDAAGVVLRVWPIKRDELPRWIDNRMRAKGMRANENVSRLLSDRAEGNMLAAAQEVDKLHLLFGHEPISEADAAQAIADSARYDVYGLVDAALAGKSDRAVHILEGLKSEGVAPPAVVWALTSEVRNLWNVGMALSRGESQAQAMRGVFKQRIPLVSGALRRLKGARIRALLVQCAHCDRVAKGQTGSKDRPWDALLKLVNDLATA